MWWSEAATVFYNNTKSQGRFYLSPLVFFPWTKVTDFTGCLSYLNNLQLENCRLFVILWQIYKINYKGTAKEQQPSFLEVKLQSLQLAFPSNCCQHNMTSARAEGHQRRRFLPPSCLKLIMSLTSLLQQGYSCPLLPFRTTVETLKKTTPCLFLKWNIQHLLRK